jgi:predicted ABC-type ATPase
VNQGESRYFYFFPGAGEVPACMNSLSRDPDQAKGAFLDCAEFVNADEIAHGLSAFRPESVAPQAGRIMLERLRVLAKHRVDFAFETTLASRSFAPWLRERQK